MWFDTAGHTSNACFRIMFLFQPILTSLVDVPHCVLLVFVLLGYQLLQFGLVPRHKVHLVVVWRDNEVFGVLEPCSWVHIGLPVRLDSEAR